MAGKDGRLIPDLLIKYLWHSFQNEDIACEKKRDERHEKIVAWRWRKKERIIAKEGRDLLNYRHVKRIKGILQYIHGVQLGTGA